MKIIKFLVCLLFVFVLMSCFSTPTRNNEPEAAVYFYENPSEEFTEIQAISLSLKTNGVIYSVDRNNALMVMEIGNYTIVDGVITINTKNMQLTGIYTDEKITIDGREFIRY